MNTVIFDLDGTLLPIDQEEFVNTYFKLLVQHLMPLGYTKDEIVNGIWKGTGAMQKNDGRMTNSELFWQVFINCMGEKAAELEGTIDEFYAGDFNKAKVCAKSTPNRKPLIDALRKKGYTLVIASNPIFPRVAMNARLSWVGLSVDDFDYTTSYSNSSFCKPSLGYYENILKEIGKKPEECIMVGNNPVEDGAAAKLGIEVYIVTDIVEGDKKDISFNHGSFEEAEEYLISL